MSFLARLTFDGANYYTVLNADYQITQSVGRANQPNRNPEIGLIHLVLESTNNNELIVWAMAPHVTKDGSITFFNRDYSDSLKTLEFYNAFCINYKEIFNADGSQPMKTELTISSHRISIQGAELQQNWAGFESGQTATTTTSPQHEESEEGEISSFRP